MRSVCHYVVFPTDLGWMGLAGANDRVQRLTFGHASMTAARRALGELPRGAQRDPLWFSELVERLQAYARGAFDEFRDVAVEVDDGATEFTRAVIEQCRHIPAGATLTYGQLATIAGRPGAARAVGNVMRTNRVPIIIPCHRVVGSGGKLHGYSALGGLEMKRRLLDLEVSARVWEAVQTVTGGA